MFQKKDIIYSGTLGVCRVEDVTKLTQKSGEVIMYYALRSVEDGEKNAYIPVEKHEVLLRELVSKEEAVRLKTDCYDRLTRQELFEVDYVLGKE